jgi:two-component system, NarL family, invasion response regulator UvrY
MIRIILIDDHTLVRNGLRTLLSAVKNIQIIGEAGTGKEGIELVRRLDPDMILLDLRLPDMDGLTIAKRLLRKNPEINILVVSANIQDLTVLRLLETGVKGYISKGAAPIELMQAIQAVHNGERFISAKLASRLALSKITTDTESVFAKITDRERQVMEQIIRGKEIKDIAAELGINHKTVYSFRDRIFQKLNVDSDVALALLAIQHGLLILDSEAIASS